MSDHELQQDLLAEQNLNLDSGPGQGGYHGFTKDLQHRPAEDTGIETKIANLPANGILGKM